MDAPLFSVSSAQPDRAVRRGNQRLDRRTMQNDMQNAGLLVVRRGWIPRGAGRPRCVRDRGIPRADRTARQPSRAARALLASSAVLSDRGALRTASTTQLRAARAA